MSRFTSFKRFFLRKRIYIPTILILALIGWSIFGNSGSANEQLVSVQSTTFVQEVGVTGKVIPSKDVDMAFEIGGRVSQVSVKVGSIVKEGQILASVSSGDQQAVVLQRQAKVDSEAAKLAEVQRGSRAEDIAIATTEVDGARVSYEQSLQTLVDQIKDAYAKVDDGVRGKADQLFKNPRTVNPEVLTFENYPLRMSVNDQRLKIGEILASWSKSIETLNSGTYTSSYLDEARTNLSAARNFFNDLSEGVSSLTASDSFPQTTIDKYKTDVSTARTAVSTAISTLSTVEQSYKSSQNAYAKAKDQLALKKAGSTIEQINSQFAILKSAQADLQSARALLAKTNITAPFNGLITKVDTKEGEIASVNANVIGLISASSYEIESYISESDIAKVRVGQAARVTLDAYGKDVVFLAKTVEVDPAETVLDGVSTYKTKLEFVEADERIRSGMTANIIIQTAEKPESVVIPQEALFLDAGEKMVTIDQGGKRINRKVETGGINAKGEIEVLSGISVGEKVVVKKK
ncbi:MAG: efflux RND transporter periplasmic adaptor subunit [Candidatus Pacebacteria bacterium]|nr:efflux RND transporter periplasmic adaptor subunit [Candidatus Paceibacterota bacterium]